MSINDIVPRIPDNDTLPQQYKGRPDWDALTTQIQGVDGKALAREHLLYRGLDDDEADAVAAKAKEAIQYWVDIDTDCKKFAKEFPEWFKNDCTARVTVGGVTVIAPVQLIIDLGKRFDGVRLAETKACESLRKTISQVKGAYDDDIAEQDAEAQRELDRIAEEDRKRQLADAEKRGTPEAEEEAEYLRNEPLPAVSKEQASRFAGTSGMQAKGMSKGKKTFKYTIVDYPKFFAFQNANVELCRGFYNPQSDGSYAVRFTVWKYQERHDIPGLKCEFDKYETQNRAGR